MPPSRKAYFAARDHARYQARIAQGRCPRCGEKRQEGYRLTICRTCLNEQSSYKRGLEPPKASYKGKADQEAFEALIARVVRLGGTTASIQEQAEELGVEIDRVYALRNAARRRGHYVTKLTGEHGGYNGPVSVAWKQLDSLTRCKACRLLNPHVCIQGSAQSRPGVGRVYPEGGC
jgi:hypothetical protein